MEAWVCGLEVRVWPDRQEYNRVAIGSDNIVTNLLLQLLRLLAGLLTLLRRLVNGLSNARARKTH